MEGQRITLDPTHTSFRNGSPRRSARAPGGAPPDDEGERKGATTLFLYGALLVACATVAGQTQFDEALERVAADAVLARARRRRRARLRVRCIAAKRGLGADEASSPTPRSTCSAPWARTAWRAYGSGAPRRSTRRGGPPAPSARGRHPAPGPVGLLAPVSRAPASSATGAGAPSPSTRGGRRSSNCRCVFPASLVVAVPGCGDVSQAREGLSVGGLKKSALATCNTRAAKSCWFQDLVLRLAPDKNPAAVALSNL